MNNIIVNIYETPTTFDISIDNISINVILHIMSLIT